jgi:hypothetical protein
VTEADKMEHPDNQAQVVAVEAVLEIHKDTAILAHHQVKVDLVAPAAPELL